MPVTKSQFRAIAHGKGPAMVLAGPGSGKTLVITRRVQYLLEREKVSPEEILVITFTRGAALQMRERFFGLMGGKRPGVTFGTFHGVFFQILKYAYSFTAQSILREETRQELLCALADRFRLEREDEGELIAQLAAQISLVKNEQIPLEHFYSSVCSASVFRDLYRAYQQALSQRHLIDFDDMLVYTWQLFRERKDVLSLWQRRFRHILVDEFQDINALQYQILRMLAAPENNLFVVGDDDQAIYRFRGAKPEVMLGFGRDYPEARILLLEENFRSSKAILQAAGQIIAQNHLRYPKNIRAVQGMGEAVEIRRFRGMETEALYLVRQIRVSAAAGVRYGQIAVLTRTNTGGRYLAEKLMAFGISVQMAQTAPNLYDHWIARDILAYVRLAAGGRERRDFLRVMNRPLRYLSRDCVEGPVVDLERLRMWYEDKPWMVERLDRLEEDLRLVGRLAPYGAVNYIRSGIGYDAYLTEYARQRRIEKEDLMEVLEELQEHSRGFSRLEDWLAHIEEYGRRLKEQRRQEKEGKQEDAVTLGTLHGAKGLEYEEVFLPDLNEGVLPHRKASLEADIEEERRLLYVGMTRAKKRLHLFYLKERYGKEAFPSRFLEVFDLEE